MEIGKINININDARQTNVSTKETGNTDKDISVKGSDNVVKKEHKIDEKELSSAVEHANKLLFKNNTHLKFEIHDKTKEIMVKIINDESGEVLREIPPKKMLDMVAKLWEIAGILVDEKR